MYIEKSEINLPSHKSNESNLRWPIIYYFVYSDMITTLYTNLHVFLHWVHWKNCSPWRISLNHILSPEGHCLFEVVMSFKLFNYLFISSCVFIMGHYFTMSVITLPLITCVIANSRLEFLLLQCTLYSSFTKKSFV